MRKPVKVGRRAAQADRDVAREWVELYRLARESPEGCYCLNPEDDPNEHVYLYADDPGVLIQLLDDFANNGTFAKISYDTIDGLIARADMKKLQAQGLSYYDSRAKLAEDYDVSERTLDRIKSIPK